MNGEAISGDAGTYTSDCVVLGAGINGLAVARDLCARGLNVVVLERDDLCSGASSTSSKLIHGGIRYLERFDLGLIRESIRERDILLRTAPHLVREYPILVPFYTGYNRPGWLIRAGLSVHDVLATGKSRGRSRGFSRNEIRKRWPGLLAEGLRGGATFVDAQVPWAERLCVEQSLDIEALGGRVFTHTRVTRLVIEGGRVQGAGAVTEHGEQIEVRAPVTVNATGPWVDTLLGDLPGTQRLIGGTKGSHIVVDPFPGAPDISVLYEDPSDHRPLWIFPWEGRYFLGTTDLTYEGDLNNVVASDEEIAYLLTATNHIIPQASLSPADILYSFAGIRPLPHSPSAASNAHISRAHSIKDHAPAHPGLLSVVGGKLTTHRGLGEDVGDAVVKLLGRRSLPCKTRSRPLPGGATADWPTFFADFERNSPLSAALSRRLLALYGVRAERVTELVHAEPELASVVDDDFGAIAAEIVMAVRDEGAETLSDILLRRTLIGQNCDVGLSAAPKCAAVAVGYLGWTDERANEEVEAYTREVRRLRPRALSTSVRAQGEVGQA